MQQIEMNSILPYTEIRNNEQSKTIKSTAR